MGAARVIISGVRAEGSAPRTVRWRVVGANNRPVAISLASYPDADACLASLLVLRQSFNAGVCSRTGSAGAWGWRFDAPSTDGAVSARSYLRRCEAEASSELFLALLPHALVQPPQGPDALASRQATHV